MGFVKDVAKVGTFGLAGLALSKKKKKPESLVSPMMTLSNNTSRPPSMIGGTRGGI